MGSRCAPREQMEALVIIQLRSLKAEIKEKEREKKQKQKTSNLYHWPNSTFKVSQEFPFIIQGLFKEGFASG